ERRQPGRRRRGAVALAGAAVLGRARAAAARRALALAGGGVRRLGAVPDAAGEVEFRVWAPNASSVMLDDGRALEPEDEGCHHRRLVADDYRCVLDTRAFAWSADPVTVPREALVLYELHVGAFSREGTFDGVVQRLPELAALGVTAIELMPVATFPGERGWGYDGVLTYAPHRAYGGPEGLARLVDAAHAHGLAVLLDVVYNHVGPGSELLAAYGPYFTDRHETFGGEAIDYSQRGVREWAIQNAELWVRDYRIDGLRLDATHAIFDETDPHVMVELAARVRAARPGALVIAEMEVGNRDPIERWGHDAQWADEFHHALHVLLTG